MNYWDMNSPLGGLPRIKNARTLRASSYDTTGGNKDYWFLKSGDSTDIMDVEGCGCIKHIWMTFMHYDEYSLRKIVLEMYWDNEENPSVRVPVGDFFGIGHAKVSHYVSLPMSVVAGPMACGRPVRHGGAMNCYFSMPFAKHARIRMINESEVDIVNLFFLIDYELTEDAIPEDLGYFHAQYRQEYPTEKVTYDKPNQLPIPGELPGKNITGEDNYVILDAEGHGQYVGCLLNIDNYNANEHEYTWPGEGDDMIFIDGENWPPKIHGTGTEDYFCAAWGFPSGKYAGPYHGVTFGTDTDEYFGKWSMYRYHIEDPIRFKESIKVTIEHGHANDQSNDYSSVAYWYQTEPHKPMASLPEVQDRLPRKHTVGQR